MQPAPTSPSSPGPTGGRPAAKPLDAVCPPRPQRPSQLGFGAPAATWPLSRGLGASPTPAVGWDTVLHYPSFRWVRGRGLRQTSRKSDAVKWEGFSLLGLKPRDRAERVARGLSHPRGRRTHCSPCERNQEPRWSGLTGGLRSPRTERPPRTERGFRAHT